MKAGRGRGTGRGKGKQLIGSKRPGAKLKKKTAKRSGATVIDEDEETQSLPGLDGQDWMNNVDSELYENSLAQPGETVFVIKSFTSCKNLYSTFGNRLCR